MTYLASITKWLEPWGPIAWGAVGLGSVLIANLGVAIAFYIYSLSRQRVVQARYVDAKINSSSVNVLAPIHQNERINLIDFFHPFYKPINQMRFENCDLMGPCNLALQEGCSFLGCNMEACEIVVVRPHVPITGATAFAGCQFINCRIFRATLLMNSATYNALPPLFKANVLVISDGTAGRLGPDPVIHPPT